jgi:CubicO group peptidase (beta-lactamase class C family)
MLGVLARVVRPSGRRHVGPFIIWLSCVAAAAWGRMAHAQPDTPTRSAAAAIERFAADFFGREMDALHVPGVVLAVVRDGQVLVLRGYGYANLEKQTPVDAARSIFRIGSISKLFTATAVLQLFEQGHVELRADVNRYLGDVKVASPYQRPVTLFDLLTHTAGLEDSYWGWIERSEATRRPLGDFLAARDLSPVRAPGEIISYCNVGLGVAGHVVELVSGSPFHQYVEAHILQPLGMERSTFSEPVPPELAGDLATAYSYRDEIYRPIPFDFSNCPPPGAMVSTGADMAAFMLAHLGGGRGEGPSVLEPATLTLMHQQQFTHHPGLAGWGFGFYERVRNGRRAIEHGGTRSGFLSYLSLIPSEGLGVFVSQNGGREVGPAFLQAFLERFYPAPAVQPPIRRRALTPRAGLPGLYRHVSYPRRTFEKLDLVRSEVVIRVRVDANGDVLLSVPNDRGGTGLDGVRFVELEPYVFQDAASERRIAFGADARGNVAYFFNGPGAYERVAFHERLETHLAALVFCVLVFVAAATVWPVGALLRRARGSDVRALSRIDRRAAAARALAGATAVVSLAFLGAVAYLLVTLPPEAILFAEFEALPYLLVVPFVMLVLTAALVVQAVFVWKDSYWGVWKRSSFTLLVATSVLFLALLWDWNLLGFKY